MPSVPVNRELIRSRAADIRGELAALRVYAGMPEEAFSVDPEKATTRLRNLLVHGYRRVDNRRLHKIIREDLGELEEFLEAVRAHTEAEGGGR